MKLIFNYQVLNNYKNQSQKARILTESWVSENVFCPSCGYFKINKYPNNQPVADFYCSFCHEDFELKSKQNNIGYKILDGAYYKKVERLNSDNNPNLFILNYNLNDFCVIDFFVIPKHFFTINIIEKRKPLGKNARRAGWIGSNILIKKIPQIGRIFLIKQKHIKTKKEVLNEWKQTLFLREEKEIISRGWLIDIMYCIEKLKKREFTLQDIYSFENELSKLHPNNKHIKDKIRQKIQILRDKKYLAFTSRGKYKLLF
ncbi:MAG: restriction endonuclease [Patescibacteria group bacterium]|nr:restriction endonuclease [Patescibacteria group bacterium]